MGNAAPGRKPLAENRRETLTGHVHARHAGLMIKTIRFLLVLALAGPAFSQGKETSSDVPYPVTGSTAPAIYENIKTAAPRIAPNATFAFTAIATKTVKAHAVGKDGCRYKRFETSAIYNFVLPSHQNAASMNTRLAKSWLAFATYLKTHEEGHRDIWRACFREYDQQAVGLAAKDCDALDSKREQLFTNIKKRCVGEDEAYDVIFRKEVLKHPFMVEALKKKKLKDD